MYNAEATSSAMYIMFATFSKNSFLYVIGHSLNYAMFAMFATFRRITKFDFRLFFLKHRYIWAFTVGSRINVLYYRV